MPSPYTSRIPSTSGIAIGPILFVIAILGVMAMAMSSSIGSFGQAGIADRVSMDVTTQANLIRTKINECNLMYGTLNNNDGYPASDANGTLVSALECTGDPDGRKNLWTGLRETQLPPPTQGFYEWYYVNAGDSGGRCFWTSPTGGNRNTGAAEGLRIAKRKFTDIEVSYIPNSNTQKFVVFITAPSEGVNSHCAVP
ncbi:MAG: hypothetical protein PHX43_07180 [Alphaproteobacteria bacterium]|nr:hypothetical protein [Alphaproteobacteria bacterium]